ncbi:MFS transporter [Corynebacterium sp. 13CS0277]|uniref:MFS transporter n=1 Tax=Corynebacterium sp. 13CS0277 TaxID=2071994 RepID=UPI000D023550|nr:MFS transporter [Corynebacterium sp. 13CS0277]PRQ12620.1 MFS transporter [Corynebacterium sp. 13CS0277]
MSSTPRKSSARTTAGLYVASTALSTMGNAIANVVWVWLVLERTGDPAAAGTVAAVISIPAILFSVLGGALIDRVGRKPMSVISDVVSSASVVLLILMDMNMQLTLTWFILVGILGAVGDVPGMAARQALVGDVAATSGYALDKLSGVVQTAAAVSFLAGPAVGGLLLGLLPVSSVLWITAACSLAAAVLTALLRLSPAAADEATAGGDETAAGRRRVRQSLSQEWGVWRSILTHPQVRLLAITALMASMLVMPYLIVLTPAHFHRIGEPGMYGITMSSYALGMIIGGIMVARWGTQRRRRIWLVALSLEAVCYATMAWLAGGWVLIAGFTLAGIGGGFLSPLTTTIITEKTPSQVRGRAFSMLQMLNLIGQPIGLSIVSMAVHRVDIYAVAVGIALCAVPLLVYSFTSGYRNFEALAAPTTHAAATD